jgi:hypothetical protein
MPQQQPTTADAVSERAPTYVAVDEQDDWSQDEELPTRPRRRLLGVGANRLALSLLGVLLIACGFVGGVLVEKGQGSSSSAGAGAGAGAVGFASRLRALRASAGSGSGSSPASAASPSGAGFTRPTAGTVAYLAGDTLYLTTSEGNTVKVTTSPSTSVTKTVKASVNGIHPGEAVTITGATAANGSVSAETISVGSSGGLAALFGAGGGAGASGSSSAAKGGEPALFGG